MAATAAMRLIQATTSIRAGSATSGSAPSRAPTIRPAPSSSKACSTTGCARAAHRRSPALRGSRDQARVPRRRVRAEACAALSRARRCGQAARSSCAPTSRSTRAVSSGEPTQGAGAVAMLVERIRNCSSAPRPASAAPRRIAPRFPQALLRNTGQTRQAERPYPDLPVFNGKYSTSCYLDETLLAMADDSKDTATASTARWNETAAAFLHRPYRRMAETGLAVSYLLALARGGNEDHAARDLARAAGVDPAALLAELQAWPQLYDPVGNATADPYPATLETLRALRAHPQYRGRCSTRCGSAIRHAGVRQPLHRVDAGLARRRTRGSGGHRRGRFLVLRSSRSATAAATPPKRCR